MLTRLLGLVANVEDTIGLKHKVAVVGGHRRPVVLPQGLGHIGLAAPAEDHAGRHGGRSLP